MFWKTAIAIILTVAAAWLTHSAVATVATFLVAMIVVFIFEGVRIVPQQNAWVVERLGKFHAVLQPGLNLIVPFFDRVAYKHSLKEIPLDVPEQICITKDNTQLTVDGIIYFQVVDPRLASYGSSDYIQAITQLAQTAVRSVGTAISSPGGTSAANLKVAELYIGAFKELARTNNTLIIPSNLSDVAGLVASAMTVLDRSKMTEAAVK